MNSFVQPRVPHRRPRRWYVSGFISPNDLKSHANPADLDIFLLFLGGVGKSCLTGSFRPPNESNKMHMCGQRTNTRGIAQFVHNEWIESYDPTIEDSYRTQVTVDVSRETLHSYPIAMLAGLGVRSADIQFRGAKSCWKCECPKTG